MPVTLRDAPEIVPSPVSYFPRGCGCVSAVILVFGLLWLFPLGNHAPSAGHRRDSPLRLTATFKSLEIALSGFEIEYSKELLETLGKPSDVDFSVGSELLSALTGDDSHLNPRKIRFFAPPAAKLGRNGIWNDESAQLQLRDNWSNSYVMRYDGYHDGKVANPEKPGEFIAATYLVYTAGRDRNPVTWEDNVTSWRPMPRKLVWFWQ